MPAPEPESVEQPEFSAPFDDGPEQELVALREVLQVAQKKLTDVQAGQGEPGLGAFQAMKEVVDARHAVTDFLKQQPELK